jgi:hypothetical protein
LRFDRDRRGYETTALIHSAGRRGKRLLYWFRTPQGVRVGRAPIDETAIHLLEQHNPDVQFDWTRILKAPAAEGQSRRDARDRDARGRRDQRPPPRSRSGGGPPQNPPPRPAVQVQPPARDIPALDNADQGQAAAEYLGAEAASAAEVAADHADRVQGAAENADYADQGQGAAENADYADQGQGATENADYADQGQGAAENADYADQGHGAAENAERTEDVSEQDMRSGALDLLPPSETGLEPGEGGQPEGPLEIDVGSAASQRLGAEGLVRLRARYAEVMARIAERPLEEAAREELKLQAERLNPDAWVTADEVTAALEQYETVFEGLRGIVGRHPRRRRGRR